MMNLTPDSEDAKVYLEALQESRTLKKHGARANNKAATADANGTIVQMQEEVSILLPLEGYSHSPQT